ncbi:PAS-domain containing protein [Sphingorhabdus arenilitoris]|uniref:histidine kinase n=1 Tax=Sphingorhabdus arenilitoris TaxID=1490041 RepID=A0ABV8RIF2_9SPHN
MDGLSTAIIGLLLAVWLVVATVAIWYGLSLRRKAAKSLRQTARLGRLLETAPAVPVVVRGDGRIEASDRFSRLLGLGNTAQILADLSGDDQCGLLPDDYADLDGKIRETQRTGSSFTQALRIAGSDRRMLVIGGIADPVIYPNGAALLWFFDLTDNLREWEKVKHEAEDAKAAFAAISGLIEEAPMPMWHRGPDYRLNFVNRAYVKAVGAQNNVDAVEQGMELIEDSDGHSEMELAAAALQSGQVQERQVSSTVDGNRRQMRVFDIPLGAAGVGGLAVDIQDLSDAQRQYRRLADAQRDLLDMMSAGVAQFDADRTLSFANLPFQRLFALRDNWLADKPEFARLLDRMRENSKIPEVRDFPEWRSDKENWFRAANPNEENWLLPDGTHLRVLAQPMPGGGLLLIFEDRTEQAQLASARDTLLRVRTATFDNLFESVAVFAADGRLSIWNRRFADIWGLEEELLGRHPRLDELLPILANLLKKPAQISVIAEILRMTTANREQRKSRVSFADGRIFQISTVPLPDGNALFTMLDMTDSVEVEQALRQRNEALSEADAVKSKFLANMSYEFRTPLTSISGFADLLKAGIAGELNAQAMEYVEAIATSADRLSQQINTVLDYSQIQVGALPIAKEPVDVTALLTELVAEHAELAASRGVNVELDLSDAPGIVPGDARRLTQAIGHILDNALRYGREDGRVLIVTQNERAMLSIIISDDGPGMNDKDRSAVFDTYARRAKDSGDKGLGLPLARQLIESHGGNLELFSQLGEGTSVVMRLPRA